jgi:hypothetical protein
MNEQNLTADQFLHGLVVCGFIAAAILVVYVALYRRYNSRPVKGPEYLHEPPADLPPAIVDALFTTAPTAAKMVATLLDLVRREVITMVKSDTPAERGEQWATRNDHALHLHRDKLASLTGAEQDFCYELFDHIARGADDALLSTLREWWQQHPATATVVAGYWGLQVRREAELRGLLQPGGQRIRSRLSLIGVCTFALPWAMAFLIRGADGGGVGVAGFATLVPLGIGLILFSQRVTALTPKGCELAGGYEALRRYMETFGHLQDKPPEAVVLWEQYLTLAVVLGLAEETVNDLYIMPPSFTEYGGAGRLGRRAYGIGRPARLPDCDEAESYAAFRRGYDQTLPVVRVLHGKTDTVSFRPSLGLATRSPFARHGIGARRFAG